MVLVQRAISNISKSPSSPVEYLMDLQRAHAFKLKTSYVSVKYTIMLVNKLHKSNYFAHIKILWLKLKSVRRIQGKLALDYYCFVVTYSAHFSENYHKTQLLFQK